MTAVAPRLLLRQLHRLLRPLVRLAITSGVTFPIMADLLRGLFVEVASSDLLSDAASRTDSRISLLTGVHRKEIRRLRLQVPEGEGIPAVVTLGSQIVARWLGTKQYCNAAGEPLALPRLRPEKAGPSFEALVESVTTDVRPRAVLDDFLAQNIISLDADDRVRLNRLAFIPSPASAEQLFFFGRNLHDHIAAAAANVAAGGTQAGAPFLDSSVHYDRLSRDAAAQLLALAHATAARALLEVNRDAMGLAEANDAAGGATRRVNFGIYVYAEDESKAEDKNK